MPISASRTRGLRRRRRNYDTGRKSSARNLFRELRQRCRYGARDVQISHLQELQNSSNGCRETLRRGCHLPKLTDTCGSFDGTRSCWRRRARRWLRHLSWTKGTKYDHPFSAAPLQTRPACSHDYLARSVDGILRLTCASQGWSPTMARSWCTGCGTGDRIGSLDGASRRRDRA